MELQVSAVSFYSHSIWDNTPFKLMKKKTLLPVSRHSALQIKGHTTMAIRNILSTICFIQIYLCC